MSSDTKHYSSPIIDSTPAALPCERSLVVTYFRANKRCAELILAPANAYKRKAITMTLPPKLAVDEWVHFLTARYIPKRQCTMLSLFSLRTDVTVYPSISGNSPQLLSSVTNVCGFTAPYPLPSCHDLVIPSHNLGEILRNETEDLLVCLRLQPAGATYVTDVPISHPLSCYLSEKFGLTVRSPATPDGPTSPPPLIRESNQILIFHGCPPKFCVIGSEHSDIETAREKAAFSDDDVRSIFLSCLCDEKHESATLSPALMWKHICGKDVIINETTTIMVPHDNKNISSDSKKIKITLSKVEEVD